MYYFYSLCIVAMLLKLSVDPHNSTTQLGLACFATAMMLRYLRDRYEEKNNDC